MPEVDSPTTPGSGLAERAGELDWYHSIELAPGQVTEGEFDHRPYVSNYGLPDRLDGRRAIDVATFDGFWAFELERRGAEVVALDLDSLENVDWPAFRERTIPRDTPLGEGFRLAHEALGSSVQRVECSVYDVTPELVGAFDLVFCGSLLIHLKSQFAALERIAALLRPGGTFVSAEAYSRALGLLPFPAARYRAHAGGAPVFWEPAAKTWRLMIEASGFRDVREVSRFPMRSDKRDYTVRHVVHHATV